MTWRRAWAAYGAAHVGKSLLWTDCVALGAAMVPLPIVGPSASALLPIRLHDPCRGVAVLATSYAAAAIIAIGFAWSAATPPLILLGLGTGTTNPVGWVILPVLRGGGARGYGLYTMASNLALGTVELVVVGARAGCRASLPTAMWRSARPAWLRRCRFSPA